MAVEPSMSVNTNVTVPEGGVGVSGIRPEPVTVPGFDHDDLTEPRRDHQSRRAHQ
jgi:hypothetical protein